MARRVLTPNPENTGLAELKRVARVESSETALRCTAIPRLIAGVTRDPVGRALLVTDRSLRKWIQAFNARGTDGLIVRKRPGRTVIRRGQRAEELTRLLEDPHPAERTLAVSANAQSAQ